MGIDSTSGFHALIPHLSGICPVPGAEAQSRKSQSAWLTPAFTQLSENRLSTLPTFLRAPGSADELFTAIQKAPCSLRATRQILFFIF